MAFESIEPTARYALRDVAYKVAASAQQLAQAQPIAAESLSDNLTADLATLATAASGVGIPVGGAVLTDGTKINTYAADGTTLMMGSTLLSVKNGALTGIRMGGDTISILINGKTQSVKDAAGVAADATIAVKGNVTQSLTLPATNAIVADKQVLTAADGGTITLAIAAGKITATYVAKS